MNSVFLMHAQPVEGKAGSNIHIVIYDEDPGISESIMGDILTPLH